MKTKEFVLITASLLLLTAERIQGKITKLVYESVLIIVVFVL